MRVCALNGKKSRRAAAIRAGQAIKEVESDIKNRQNEAKNPA